MKKLFFTAIALVAFSGISMASTIEIEKSVEVTKPSVIVCEERKQNCEEAAVSLHEIIIGNGADNLVLLNQLIALCHPELK